MTVNKSEKLTSQQMKGMLHKMAPEVIREKIQDYLRCLKEGKCMYLLATDYISLLPKSLP